MHIHSHFSLIKNAMWFILLCIIGMATAAFLFAYTRPAQHIANISFETQFINRPASTDYQYGGYYEQKSSEMFTQHVMSIFQSPSVVKHILEDADIEGNANISDAIVQRFTVRQQSNQHFTVQFSDTDSAVRERLAKSVIDAVVNTANTSGTINQKPYYAVVAHTPFMYTKQTNPWKASCAGALIGLFASVLLVYIRDYLKS